MSAVCLFGRPLTKCRPFALWSVHKEGPMRTLAHGLPSRPLGAHLAAADALSGGCCWSSSTRAFVVEVYTSEPAGRTVPGARRVRICVLFNVIVRYTRGTSRKTLNPTDIINQRSAGSRKRNGRFANKVSANCRVAWPRPRRGPAASSGPGTGRGGIKGAVVSSYEL